MKRVVLSVLVSVCLVFMGCTDDHQCQKCCECKPIYDVDMSTVVGEWFFVSDEQKFCTIDEFPKGTGKYYL